MWDEPLVRFELRGKKNMLATKNDTHACVMGKGKKNSGREMGRRML